MAIISVETGVYSSLSFWFWIRGYLYSWIWLCKNHWTGWICSGCHLQTDVWVTNRPIDAITSLQNRASHSIQTVLPSRS